MKKITRLPTPPNSKDSINFNERADNFVGALPTFCDEVNAFGDDVEKAFTAQNQSVGAQLNTQNQNITAQLEAHNQSIEGKISENDAQVKAQIKTAKDEIDTLSTALENKVNTAKASIDSVVDVFNKTSLENLRSEAGAITASAKQALAVELNKDEFKNAFALKTDLDELKNTSALRTDLDAYVLKDSLNEMIAEALGTAKTEYSGNGSPDIQSNLSTANNGALYTDKGTNDIYIKNNDSWQKINTDVATFSGSGRPSNEDGRALGTIYKDTSTNDIYVKAFIGGKNVYKKIKDGIAISDDVVLIPDDAEANAVFGDIGGYGAGVAYLPQSAAKVGLSPLSGASEKSNDNFGNFEDEFGNIFVCIPRMYYKADGDNRNNDKNAMFFNKPNIYLSYASKDGYEPFYAFKKSDGSYVNCVFVSKYLMGLSNGKTISARGQDVLTSANGTDMAKYNGLGQISGLTSNNAGFFDAAKKMNSHTTLHYAALRFVYYMVAEAHTQEAARIYGGIAKVPSAICAYLDKQPYFPKGCNSILGDRADTSVKYTQGTKSVTVMGKTGSATNQAKTTFNGQMCGIADMGGLAWEVDAGYINNDGTTYALKGIALLKNMTSSSYSNVSNYTALILANRRDASAAYCGNGENQIFSLRDSKSSANAMLCDNFLIPLSNGMSSSGTDAYGKDYNYPLTSGSAPLFGGNCSSDASCGLLYMHGTHSTWSGSSSYCSARTIVVP